MGFFGLGRQREQEAVIDALYAKAVAQARKPAFYAHLSVPDTVDGRFDLLALHMFLLLHRLGGEGPFGKKLAQGLFDLMFDDMDRSLREMGVSDMSVGKRVKEMARALYGRIDAYEPCLKDEAKLASALIRNLYRGAAVPAEHVMIVARYVQAQAKTLAEHDLASLTDSQSVCFTVEHLP
jgi:cytochrome b pre-mRNA-processing protein 3